MLDFPFYASNCLKIRTKEGSVVPFALNSAQKYLHEKLEEQKREKGNVRALVLKGRQQGISTYTEARLFWRATHREGVRTFILTHDHEATNNLFEMVARFYEHCPEQVRPLADKQNAKELYFSKLDSGYKVGTAGNKAVGRSSTVQYFHGSEVAFWPHADEHAKGILQAISSAPDTEIILESTANGTANYFYEQWQRAESGKSDFIPVFIPWFWQEEYTRQVKDGFTCNNEEQMLVDFYGLTNEQLNWRRHKIEELSSSGKDGVLAFQQEYPCNPTEAFTVSTVDTLIKIDSVMRAQKNTGIEGSGAKILGVDVARFGDDFTILIRRHGRNCYNLEKFSNKDGIQIAGLIYERFNKENFDYICIDIIGVGASVFDQLRNLLPDSEFSKRVIAVNAAETKSLYLPSQYVNKRAEMWGQMKEWFSSELDVSIPRDSEFLSQLCSQRYDFKAHGKMALLSKKEDGLPSPDKADALSLTFALPESKLNAQNDNIVNKLRAYNNFGVSALHNF